MASKSGKGTLKDSHPEPSAGMQLHQHLDFSPLSSFRLLTSWTVRGKFCCFKPKFVGIFYTSNKKLIFLANQVRHVPIPSLDVSAASDRSLSSTWLKGSLILYIRNRVTELRCCRLAYSRTQYHHQRSHFFPPPKFLLSHSQHEGLSLQVGPLMVKNGCCGFNDYTLHMNVQSMKDKVTSFTCHFLRTRIVSQKLSRKLCFLCH